MTTYVLTAESFTATPRPDPIRREPASLDDAVRQGDELAGDGWHVWLRTDGTLTDEWNAYGTHTHPGRSIMPAT